MEDIGQKLRAARAQRGISQRELARVVGVSNGTISQIENGQTDPSFSLIMKILEGLNITITSFFQEREQRQQRVFFKPEDMVDVGSGNIQYLQLGANSSGRKLQFMREVYPAGASSGPKVLSHVGEEAGMVIKGKLEVHVGDQIRNLGPGESYYFDSTIPHKFRNREPVPCELITACTPPF